MSEVKNLSQKQYNSSYTQEQWRWVAERYLDGYPVAELAMFLHMHYNSVIYHLARMGVYPRQRLPLSEMGFPVSNDSETILKILGDDSF